MPSPTTQPYQPQPQNGTRPTQIPGSPNGIRLGPIDLAFLIDGCDAVNKSFFRTMLEIVKDTLSRFPISVNRTHVAVAVYATETKTVLNLKDVYDSSKIIETLGSVTKPSGVCLAGKALRAVEIDIFNKTGRNGASRVLLHIMCSKSFDDVIQPAKDLKKIGVKIVAAGACPKADKADLCNIGSPPLCSNSVFMQILNPPSLPGRELAERLKQG